MSYKPSKYCLHSSLIIAFMLLLHVCNAQYDFTRTDAWLKENLKELGGRAVLMIYKDGKIIHSTSANELSNKQARAGKMLARKTGKDPETVMAELSPVSRINIASCSKWLSAALIMTFIDDGKLRLADSIGKYLPSMTANGKGNITIADCLSHQTGIKSGNLKESREFSNNAKNMDEAMAFIAVLPVESMPGTSFHYSGIGLQIAAAVIEKISGQNFEKLFKDRIAGPCEMIHTDFGNKVVPMAAGGAMSSAADYLNFLKMILADGVFKGKKVLSKESVDLMQQNYSSGKKIIYSPAEAGNWGYGFGEWMMENSANGEHAVAVTSPGLFGSFPWIDHKHNYAAVLFTFNLKSKGRHERYTALKQLIDSAITIN
ncbi:hypothetical protein BH11BAC4_BH11BAC4_03970 [soil metagenome]